MYKVNIDHTSKKDCSLWVDLTVLPNTEQMIHDVLGLNEDQVDFITTPILGDHYKNSYTTLYYPYCSFVIKDHIVKDLTKVLSYAYPYLCREESNEDEFTLPMIQQFNPQGYVKLTPSVAAASLVHYNGFDERIIVHRVLLQNRHLVQYRYRLGNNYDFTCRLLNFLNHKIEFCVSNYPTRTVLQKGL